MLELSLENRELTLWQVLGPDAPAVMQTADVLIPDVMSAVSDTKGFIARTGVDEFIIQSNELTLPEKKHCWVYRRADCTLALQGEGWREVMAQVCHQDFSDIEKDDWLMLSAAGINIWCLGLSEGLLIGCDPSLGDYFSETLDEIVGEFNEKIFSDKG